MGMKYRDPETGQFKDLKVKTSDTLPIGTQVAYGGTVPPTGWLICDGSAVSRTTYAELFKVIGTSYGEGDGSTTFNLPNNIQPTEVDNWIIKAFQSIGVVGKVVNTKTNSDKDTYSCNYINKFDGVILYEDETGINTTVNLKESVANYKYIDIFFRDDNNIYDTKRFFVKNGAWYTLQITQYNEDSSNVIIRGKNIQLNADKIYNGKYCAVLLSSSGNTLYWNNNIYICKVIGYK